MAPKTDVIEQLRERVRELEEENARLRFALADTEALELETSERLAASQAYAEQLRVALNTAAEKFHDYAEFHSMKDRTRDNIEKTERNLDLARMCDKALAIPHDTSALDAYVAEKVKEATLPVCRALEAIKGSEAMAQGEKK